MKNYKLSNPQPSNHNPNLNYVNIGNTTWHLKSISEDAQKHLKSELNYIKNQRRK